MELQLELELEWELKWKLEWEMELQPHKPRELQLDPPKIRVWGQNGGSRPWRPSLRLLLGVSGATFKTRKWDIRPRRPAIQSTFSLGDSHQTLTFKEP